MIIIEILLLIIAYTLLVVTIFVEVVCYIRNIEPWQTLAFTVSLLLLIIALSMAQWLYPDSTSLTPTNVFILLAMALVGVTTPLNVLEERQHQIKPVWKKLLILVFFLVFVAAGVGHFTNTLGHVQYVVAFLMGLSVVLSMVLVISTKPVRRIAHREKIERKFSVAFMVLIPLSMLTNYVIEEVGNINLKFGFTLPLIFILLAASKLMDDLQRLSILNPSIEPKVQHFTNFHLTERERQMATLLLQGKSYREIAEELYISMPTVKTHTSNIYKKCGVSSRYELTVLLSN